MKWFISIIYSFDFSSRHLIQGLTRLKLHNKQISYSCNYNYDNCNNFNMSSIDNIEEIPNSELIYLARISEQCERYEDMTLYISQFIRKERRELTKSERTVLSSAYKGLIGAKRQAWRMLSSIKTNEENKGSETNVARAETYKGKLEAEVKECCNGILTLIDSDLIPVSSNAEAKVFYSKLKGDYYRYISECSLGSERDAATQSAYQSYRTAYDSAIHELACTNPIRLGLALNFSVFNFEILRNKQQACRLAKQAFDEGTAELGNVSAESYKECSQILDLLRDNLQTWSS